MSVTIIINPISGGLRLEQARARVELAAAVVEEHGEQADVFLTERRGHAREIAKSALVRGARLVLAWGGDGTINEVASSLAFQEVPLGIIPSGSGNGLARELGVDFRPERAIAGALGAEPRAIDLGEVNGHLFVNVAGVGFDAYVAAEFDKRGSHRRGLVGYFGVTARALVSYRPGRYTITTPQGCTVSQAILVTVANSAQFGNGARIAPRALLDDGLLDLVVVEERARWRTICHVPRLFDGTVEQIEGCSICHIQQATIRSDQPMVFHVDGEPVDGGTELQVRVHPAALRVAVK
jgi:YegS/Rv2252/BmrU family lipid kinase